MNTLAKNIKYLRKRNKWSQAELARRLNLKRSSIAAYESKDVEPRLNIIIKLTKLFNVSLIALIEQDIETEKQDLSKDAGISDFKNSAKRIESLLLEREKLEDFKAHSIRIKKMLEGFKAFYNYKLEFYEKQDIEVSSLLIDLENFVQLIEHLLQSNESVINTILPNERRTRE